MEVRSATAMLVSLGKRVTNTNCRRSRPVYQRVERRGVEFQGVELLKRGLRIGLRDVPGGRNGDLNGGHQRDAGQIGDQNPFTRGEVRGEAGRRRV